MALARIRLQGRDPGDVSAFLDAVKGADLVIATGGGYLTDVWEEHAKEVVSTLTLGIRARKYTALLGHGLGPLQSPTLRAEVAAVLRSVDLITLRENRAGGQLLRELGVRPDRVITTGDDAVELAYRAHQPEIGTGIGINLRVASYSQVDDGLASTVRSSIRRAAGEHRAPFVPVPISVHGEDSDSRSIRELIAEFELASGVETEPQTPLELTHRVGRCRVVVTGSYHAGVFALSQGIPVVALAKSAYYRDKFLGLSEQFGIGCWVVMLDEDALQERIIAAIRDAWNSAGQVRSPLLAAARRQIELGQAAYQRLYQLVSERQRRQAPHCQRGRAALPIPLGLGESA
jgi:colanic acid/amylovoran biosynthesis protein